MPALAVAPEPDGTAAKVAELVEVIHRIDDEIARDQETRALYVAQLADLLPDGTTRVGDSKIVITRPRRFNAGAFQEAYGPDTNPGLYVPALDRKKADAWLELTGTDPDPFYTVGKRQVTVR